MKLLSKIVFYCIFILILYSCKRSNNEIDKNEDYIIKIDSNKCLDKKKNVVVLFFESAFYDDLVEVKVNQHEKFKGKISTDNTLGLAKEIELGKITDIKNIDFKINNGKAVILNNIDCNFIFVNHINDSLVTVDFSDKFVAYN